MPEESKSNSSIIWGVVVLVIAVVAYGAFRYTKDDASIEVMSNSQPLTEQPFVPPIMTTSVYKDGSYSSVGAYVSPWGDESIDVSLVLKDDVVVDATVKALATRPVSVKMQGAFVSGFKAQVVGKKLSEVTLTKVSGSSLTSKGWNDAVAKIMVQAKA